eukprot:jgi/Tetstr1/447234/TSEL_034671.t1
MNAAGAAVTAGAAGAPKPQSKPILSTKPILSGRDEWISQVIKEQDARLRASASQKRNARFAGDGTLGKATPPPVYMKTDFERDTNAEKRDSAATNAITKAKAVSENKYMSRYKDSVKHLQTILEKETEAMEQVREHESEKTARMEASYRLVKESEEKIALAEKTAQTSTNATAKGKALADIHKFHVARRKALRELALNTAAHRTDVLAHRARAVSMSMSMSMATANANASASTGRVEGGFSVEAAFHAEDDPFCFFC